MEDLAAAFGQLGADLIDPLSGLTDAGADLTGGMVGMLEAFEEGSLEGGPTSATFRPYIRSSMRSTLSRPTAIRALPDVRTPSALLALELLVNIDLVFP